MLFTEGELNKFKRMMRETPRLPRINNVFEFNQLHGLTIQKRNCPNCLFYDSRLKQCKKERCVVFET